MPCCHFNVEQTHNNNDDDDDDDGDDDDEKTLSLLPGNKTSFSHSNFLTDVFFFSLQVRKTS